MPSRSPKEKARQPLTRFRAMFKYQQERKHSHMPLTEVQLSAASARHMAATPAPTTD